MSDLISILFPIGAIMAAVIAHFAVKNHWKMADWF